MKKKVLCAGHICLDITPVFGTGREYDSLSSVMSPGRLVNVSAADIHTGGCVANTGLAMKLLGCDVTLAGKVGNDRFGKMISEIVSEHGCSGLIVEEGADTSYSVVIAPPGIDRIFLHCP
ncbi:MAG: carbohydrate kinase family protein, partial [Clostridia bacterium]|nr:carbohydrate kinase family protein [Clostridia bacterium]